MKYIDRILALFTLLAVLASWVYGFGKLSQKVDDLGARLDRIENKIFNGGPKR